VLSLELAVPAPPVELTVVIFEAPVGPAVDEAGEVLLVMPVAPAVEDFNEAEGVPLADPMAPTVEETNEDDVVFEEADELAILAEADELELPPMEIEVGREL